jgi:hypothetical protein
MNYCHLSLLLFGINKKIDQFAKINFVKENDNGDVGKKPSETRNKPHFQRHSFPGPDFCAENALFAVSSLNFTLATTSFAIFSYFFTAPVFINKNCPVPRFPSFELLL